MTLPNKYDEIMEHITVTEEMRNRVLQNVRRAAGHGRAKTVRFPQWRRYLAAACFAVLLAGCLVLPAILRGPQVQQPAGSGSPAFGDGTAGITEYASAQELSQALGFPVSDLSGLPFSVSDTAYIDSFGALAEIEYTGSDGQTAVYRKSAGTDDNSGIYDTFADTEQLAAGSLRATVKGDGTQFTLAVWTDGSYAYSLALSRGVGLDEWRTILGSVS